MIDGFMILAILLVIIHFYMAYSSKLINKPFVGMLFICSLYYGVIGPLFWLINNDGVFIGESFADYIGEASFLITFWNLIFALSYILFNRKLTNFNNFAIDSTKKYSFNVKLYNLIGIISIIYVYINLGNYVHLAKPFLLIAYTLSDLCIPLILISISVHGYNKKTISYLVLYIIYSILIGFRYRIVLILLPLVMTYSFNQEIKIYKRLGIIITYSSLILIIFTLLTLIRVKFDAPDLSELASFGLEEILYGLFSESNTIFMLSSIIKYLENGGSYIFLTPITDALLELIPRFLYPDRVTGEYLKIPFAAIGTDQAYDSGAAFPYIGEIMLMGGQFAAIIIIPIVAYMLHKITSFYLRLGKNIGGMGIYSLATFFGYLYFSRGYMPFILKEFIVIILIYVTLCNNLLRGQGK